MAKAGVIMKYQAKRVLSAMFVGCMLLSAAVMRADAVDTAQNIQSDNASTLASSPVQPYPLLQEWSLDTGSRGTDETPKFTMEKEKASIFVGTVKCQKIQSLSMSIYMTLEKEKSSLPCLRK